MKILTIRSANIVLTNYIMFFSFTSCVVNTKGLKNVSNFIKIVFIWVWFKNEQHIQHRTDNKKQRKQNKTQIHNKGKTIYISTIHIL